MLINTFIIVPARSGSKGIPDKNIKRLGNQPLIAWTAQTLQAAKLPDSLAILSTDDSHYAEVGRAAGLQVPFIRPTELATDKASSIAVVEHALHWFERAFGYLPKQVMLLQPTSPFRPAGLLAQALTMLQVYQADSVVSCKEIHRDPTTLFSIENDFLKPLSAKPSTYIRRQDIPPLLTPNGSLYLCKTEVIREKKTIYGEHALPLIMDDINSLDIDTLSDWAIAEAYVQGHLV